jgi:hypothetical protein
MQAHYPLGNAPLPEPWFTLLSIAAVVIGLALIVWPTVYRLWRR